MGVGKNIKNLRESAGMSQAELAKVAGVTDKAVSSWENETRMPRMGAIQKVAGYFGLDKTDIISDKPIASANAKAPPVNGDEELTEYLEHLRTRPEMKMLFSLTKSATKEDVEKAVKIIEALLGK